MNVNLPTKGITWSDDREEGEDEEACDSCRETARGTLVDDEDGGFVFEHTNRCDRCRDGLCDECAEHDAGEETLCPACKASDAAREMREEDAASRERLSVAIKDQNRRVMGATFDALMVKP
jgi:hypothetical protein